MARERDAIDYEREHDTTLAKIARKRANLEEAYEAQEEAIRKVTKQALKANRKGLNQDFLNKYNGREKPDKDLMDFLRGSNDGINNADYEPDPTGFEDRYWDDE